MFRPNRPIDRSLALSAVGALVLGVTACGDQTPGEPTGQPEPTTTVTVTEAPDTTEPTDPAPEPTDPAREPTAEPTEAEPTEAEPPDEDLEGDGLGDPMDQQVPFEIRAETQNFTVEVLEFETDGDGVQVGANVEVCYTNEIEGMEKAPVTLEPWSFGVFDGETMAETYFLKVTESDPGNFQEPAYEPTELALGECQQGWIQIETGNPDLIAAFVRYERADTGERITFIRELQGETPPPERGE